MGVANQIKFKNILYTTDLSFAAERALPYALEIARRYGSTIHVVHVMQRDIYPLVPPSAWDQMAKAEEAFRQESRKQLEEQLGAVPHEIVFRPGKTWQTLSGLIEEKNIGLVVFSTRGGSGLEKALFGSVAEEIIRKAPCPVLAVGPSVAPGPKASAKLNRILFATDFSAESLAAVPYAISMAQEHDAQLILFHSIEKKGDVGAMLLALRQLVPLGVELTIEPDCIVEHGAPAGRILDAAEGHGADLIVLGTHGHERLIEKYVMRPGISRIVSKSKCPVLLVPG